MWAISTIQQEEFQWSDLEREVVSFYVCEEYYLGPTWMVPLLLK